MPNLSISLMKCHLILQQRLRLNKIILSCSSFEFKFGLNFVYRKESSKLFLEQLNYSNDASACQKCDSRSYMSQLIDFIL